MSATATATAGKPQILATYDCDEGKRQLVGQRVNGTVHISDVPASDHGRVYLVEKGLTSMGELQGIVADYLEKAAELGHAPERGWLRGAAEFR